jgi:hypothetical protein
MRDFRDAKAMAQTLRDALKAKSVSLTHTESLELVAKTLGFHDWNVLAAKIQSERRLPVAEPGTTPPVAAFPMVRLPDHVDNTGQPVRQEVSVDAALLDGYVGLYQAQEREHGLGFVGLYQGQEPQPDFLSVTRFEKHLVMFLRVWPNPSIHIYPQNNTEFFERERGLEVHFIIDAQGQAESLILGRAFPWRRIDPTAAQRIFDKMAEKVKSQSASPGTEAVLRGHIEGLISGKPLLPQEIEDKLGSEKAAAMRRAIQEGEFAQSGPLQSLQFLHVSRQGEDVYFVKRERGEWHGVIALNPSGTISSISFSRVDSRMMDRL